jgi:hypothetical protein
MNRLYITTKDRPTELAILCKSLLHSDIQKYIHEVVFIDDGSEDTVTMQRIFSSMSYSLLQRGIRSKWLPPKDGRSGINQSLNMVRYFKSDLVWILNGDMMVFSNYFERCYNTLMFGLKKYGEEKSLIVSGFDTHLHPHTEEYRLSGTSKVDNVGGCSEVFRWKDLDSFLDCLSTPVGMNRGWDMYMGRIFDNILVTTPSSSQHIGILTGLNQVSLAGWPGAWANVEVNNGR